MRFTLARPMSMIRKHKHLDFTNPELLATRKQIMKVIRKHIDEATLSESHDTPKPKKRFCHYDKLVEYCNKEQQVDKSNLIYNIRYVIINEYQNARSQAKYVLLYWHSLLDILQICEYSDKPLCTKISEWVNMHFYTTDIRVHAMRGNFSEVKKVYPELTEAFDELEKINEDCMCGCDDSIEHINLDVTHEEPKPTFLQRIKKSFGINTFSDNKFASWKKKYESKLPEQVKSIFFGKYDPTEDHWVDQLLYNILFVHRKQEYIFNSIEDIKEIITEQNIYAKILVGDVNATLDDLDDIMKIVYFFVMYNKNVKNRYFNMDYIENVFDGMFRKYLHIDLDYSLSCLSYNSHFDLYYSFFVNNTDMRKNELNSFLRFANENRLQADTIIDKLATALFNEKQYKKFLDTLHDFEHYNFTFDYSQNEFVLFCIDEYETIKDTLKKLVVDIEFLAFIKFLGSAEQDENIMYSILRSKYFKRYHQLIFEKVAHHKLSYMGCLSVLNMICDLECKEMKFDNQYKRIMLEKMMQNVSL